MNFDPRTEAEFEREEESQPIAETVTEMFRYLLNDIQPDTFEWACNNRHFFSADTNEAIDAILALAED